MNIDLLQQKIKTLLDNSDFSLYLKKIWVYKESTLVSDFEVDGIKFALDYNFDNEGKLRIYLVDRNWNTNFFINKSYNKKFLMKKSLDLLLLDTELLSLLKIIIDSILKNYSVKISVIVPVYNRENLISKCINSLINQTLDKSIFEVIFVDDCSRDNTVSKIQELCSNKLNFYILKRPVGSGNACAPRNDGIKKAIGRYIFFLDSDDYLADNCLESTLAFAQANDSDVTFIKIGSDIDHPRSIPTRTFKNGSVGKATVYKNNLMRSNAVFKFYKRDFILKNKFSFDQSIPLREDKIFSVQVLSKTNKVSILADQPYIFVTGHEGDHLSRASHDIFLESIIYPNGYNCIYLSDLNEEHCNELDRKSVV